MGHKTTEPLRGVLQDARNQELLEMGYPLETWQFENESISGARLTREDTFGGRLSYNQLIALRPSDAETFILGVTAWANVTRTGQLQIGMRYLPGTAQPVSIRVVNPSEPEKYVPGFLMPEIASLNTPASLILPRDRFQTGRTLEIIHQNGENQPVEMELSIERGIDYERVSFSSTYLF